MVCSGFFPYQWPPLPYRVNITSYISLAEIIDSLAFRKTIYRRTTLNQLWRNKKSRPQGAAFTVTIISPLYGLLVRDNDRIISVMALVKGAVDRIDDLRNVFTLCTHNGVLLSFRGRDSDRIPFPAKRQDQCS